MNLREMDRFHKKIMMQNLMGHIQQHCRLKQVFICLHIIIITTTTTLGCVLPSNVIQLVQPTAVLHTSIQKKILQK